MNKKLLSVVFLAVFALASTATFVVASEDVARDPERILARVEGQEIKERHVEQLLRAAGPQAVMMYDNEQGRRMILEELIASHLFALSARGQGLDETAEFKSLVDNFMTHSLARALMEVILEDVTVTDEDSRNFYDENLGYFVTSEQIRARHILLADDGAREERMAFIQGELERGVSFGDLAVEYSIDPSARHNSGDLGFFGRGQMVPEFEDAAFALEEPGDISAPVRSNFGWHIIQLEEKSSSSVTPFEEVRIQIEQFLLNELRTEKYQETLEALRGEFTVEIMED